MDIRRLRYLCQLAESGNYTQAAQRLGIAQSALSMAIKKLEEEVGLKLINRAERQMTLTTDGQVLFKHAGLILEAVHEAEREIQELKGIESGVVNFGATSMISSYYLPKVLAAFKQRYPGVRINLIEAGTASLQQMLLDSELDLALIRTDKVHEQLRHVELFEEQVMACLPRSHPLAQQPTITLQAFCREPLVLFREGYFLREAVSRYCQQHQLTLDIRFETNLVELLKSLVISGVGISTGLSMILEQEDALVALPFEPPIPLYLGLGWKKSHYLSKAGQAFVEYLQQHL
ncbi:MAG: LysR substrate-binding domain-containing protein [Motiliproteus sp.]